MIVGAQTFVYMKHQELVVGEQEPEEQSSSQDPSPPTPPTPQGLDHQKDKHQEENLMEQAEEKNRKVLTQVSEWSKL